jgi:cation-transporting ATPase 13A2
MPSQTVGMPDREVLRIIYGDNKMDLESLSTFEVVVNEMITPFYIFQYFAVAVWLATNYYVYSVIVLLITLLSIVFTVKAKLFNMKRLQELAGLWTMVHFITSERVEACLDTAGSFDRIIDPRNLTCDKLLLPGDCFGVTPNMVLPCDAVLISGRIVVDESMLTGESVPVSKSPHGVSLDGSPYDVTKRSANMLFSGTRVKDVSGGSGAAVAMTYRTGFRSARGQLIAALISPKVWNSNVASSSQMYYSLLGQTFP